MRDTFVNDWYYCIMVCVADSILKCMQKKIVTRTKRSTVNLHQQPPPVCSVALKMSFNPIPVQTVMLYSQFTCGLPLAQCSWIICFSRILFVRDVGFLCSQTHTQYVPEPTDSKGHYFIFIPPSLKSNFPDRASSQATPMFVVGVSWFSTSFREYLRYYFSYEEYLKQSRNQIANQDTSTTNISMACDDAWLGKFSS